ncbi:MAG: hypothetical protein LBI56_02245 [Puniceicoccales bacterium]|jgi:hypothetical protein|nr:hypothetical protein [Puniceicoccales bacterium]
MNISRSEGVSEALSGGSSPTTESMLAKTNPGFNTNIAQNDVSSSQYVSRQSDVADTKSKAHYNDEKSIGKREKSIESRDELDSSLAKILINHSNSSTAQYGEQP